MQDIDYERITGLEVWSVVLLKELGRGNMGVVFIGFQKTLKRQVAVKLLPKGAAVSDESRRQFHDEAEVIAGLSHPNIIPIFEMGETGEFYYQIMQLVTGRDLNTIIKDRLRHPVAARRLLPLDQVVDVMAQVLDGLGYAHEEGIVHQDVKPANILIEQRSGRPLIADFGIARTAQMEVVNTGMIVGSPLYLSPEQACAQPTDNRSDIYSAGVVLLQMAAGELPVRREEVHELLARKLSAPETIFTMKPSQASQRIDAELERIILRAVAVSPRERYRTCGEFRDDLLRYQGGAMPRSNRREQ